MDLGRYREEKGLSYEKLSKKLGFSKSYTWKICQHPEVLRVCDINKIINAIGDEVDFRSLIKGAV